MSQIRCCAVLAIGFFGFSGSPSILAAPAVAPSPRSVSHAQHLIQAEKDLLAAEAAIGARNPAAAHQAVSAAITQVQQAITHHHTNVIAKFPMGYGLTGLVVRAQHQQHHDLLHRSLAHLHAAQKSLKANNGTAALQHVELGGREIKASLASHQHLRTY